MILSEVREVAKEDRRLRTFSDAFQQNASGLDEFQARHFVRNLVLALQAALLIRHAPADVADAFCATRLAGEGGAFGLLPSGTDAKSIIARAAPASS